MPDTEAQAQLPSDVWRARACRAQVAGRCASVTTERMPAALSALPEARSAANAAVAVSSGRPHHVSRQVANTTLASSDVRVVGSPREPSGFSEAERAAAAMRAAT